MKAVVAAFNQEKALVGAFSVITNLRMDLFQALELTGLALDLNDDAGSEDDFMHHGRAEAAGGGDSHSIIISHAFWKFIREEAYR